MNWIQLKIAATKENSEFYSELLTATGAVAVTFEDAEDQPIFEPTPGTTPLWNDVQLVALFEANTDMDSVKQKIQLLMDDATYQSIHIEALQDQNWTKAWMDQFQAMRFGKNLWICPSFREIPDPNGINILLDPGMAFGTGTHATTALCLEWLDANPPKDKLVLDYGCGSGILGIAALKLGAKFVYAVDHDDQALQSTLQNATQNGYDQSQISMQKPEALNLPQQVDLILANILANPLVELMPKFAEFLRPNGIIVLSGILENQTQMILDCYQAKFKLLNTKIKDDWVCIEGVIDKSYNTP